MDRCNKCNKYARENTEGNKRYCQGHQTLINGVVYYQYGGV